MSRSLKTELKSDSESSDSDLDSKFHNELMTKLEKSSSDSEWDILLLIIFIHRFLCMPVFLRE